MIRGYPGVLTCIAGQATRGPMDLWLRGATRPLLPHVVPRLDGAADRRTTASVPLVSTPGTVVRNTSIYYYNNDTRVDRWVYATWGRLLADVVRNDRTAIVRR
jgi:hypothetical protein